MKNRKLDADLRALGFTFEGFTGGGHRRYRHVSGQQMICAGSASCHRASLNALSIARRIVRDAEEAA